MKTNFTPNSLPALIGSLPMKDHQEATDLMLQYTPQIPLWVQLPLYPEEGMIEQFLPGMPGYNQDKEKVYIDTTREDYESDLLAFYEEYMGVVEGKKDIDNTRFALSQDRAKGFYVLLETLKKQEAPLVAVKGQITGPITFATSVKDQDKRAIFYNDQLRDAAVKLIGMKARWQVEQLSKFNVPVIIFLDEPALAGFGSSEFISITKQDVMNCFAEVIEQVQFLKGLTGVHVCANADWSLILDSDADILSFDAYSYFEKLLLYHEELKGFLNAGKIIAWGIVPTLEPNDIARENLDSLYDQLEEEINQLTEKLESKRSEVLAQSLITPSCGTGSLNIDQATKVLKLTSELSKKIRNSQ